MVDKKLGPAFTRAGSEEARVDYRLDDFKLDVPGSSSLDVDIAESVTGAELELTIEGGSTLTLTVEDPDRRLIRSDTLTRWVWGDFYEDESAWVRSGRPVNATLGDLKLRLVSVAKQGTTLTLTFEERIVTYLRRHRGARKVSADTMTRAQFVQLLVDEVKAEGGILLYCPELYARQPRARARTTASSEVSSGKGIDSGGSLTVKGKVATADQLRNMETVLGMAEELNAGPKATLALVEACIVESLFRNPQTATDHDSIGILQLRVGLHGRENAASISRSVRLFLTRGFTGKGGAIELARTNPGWSAGQIAQAVQGSAFPSRYDEVRDEARKIVSAYEGGGGREDGSKTTRQRREYKRGKDETSWDAIGRLAEEVNWRRFVRSNRLWYVSEEMLFAQAARFRVAEGEGAVETLGFELDLDARKPVAEVVLTVRAEPWTALPGMVVIVDDAGPASGRWLVSTVRGSLFDPFREVVLRKPLPKKREVFEESSEEDGDSAARSKAEQVYAAADRIHRKGYPYVWGGGHAKAGTPSGGGYDCSGAVGAALAAAGLGYKTGDPVPASGVMARSWGKPGRGDKLTVWANDQHVFIEFNLSGKAKRFDTSPHGDGPKGARLRRSDRGTEGFTPRHWPGV